MNLNYSVLWFDDSKEFFDAFDTDYLHHEITSWGFTLDIKIVHSPEEFMQMAPWKNYDLIVVDFSLEGSPENGDAFIQKIRENQVFTEIIFYSANNISELWKSIHDKQLEGVYVATKTNIGTKVIRVAEQSVHKVLDLENMRGIVMAQVGELDLLLDRIFVDAMTKLPQATRTRILDKGHENITATAAKQHKKLQSFIDNPTIEEFLTFLDSGKRWINLLRIAESHDSLKEFHIKDTYVSDILKKRNCLAHGVPILQEDGGHLFIHGKDEFHFNDASSLSLRLLISQYKELLNKVMTVVTSLPLHE